MKTLRFRMHCAVIDIIVKIMKIMIMNVNLPFIEKVS